MRDFLVAGMLLNYIFANTEEESTEEMRNRLQMLQVQ